MRAWLFVVLFLAFSLNAADVDTALRNKLFRFLESTQIQDHIDDRFNGLWLNRVQNKDVLQSSEETDLFTGLHILLMLDEVNKISPLTGFESVKERFNAQFERYRKDAEHLSGTLNFWPLRDSGVHNFSTDPQIVSVVGIPDIPNDFDDTAMGFIWKAARGDALSSDWLDALNEFHDPESGAFFTWFAPEREHIDCVVNLNVLHAMAVYENKVGPMPEELMAKRDAALAYIKGVLEQGKTGTCARFYSRSSQFFVALARVHHARSEYVTFVELVKHELAKLAADAVHSKNGTEIAEYIIALKYLDVEGGSAETLAGALRALIRETPETAFLEGDSVFTGRTKDQNWYSSAQSTATALLALLL